MAFLCLFEIANFIVLYPKVEREKIKELLIEYWNIRSNDTDFFLDKAEHAQN